MAVTVKLKDIIDGMEFQTDDGSSHVNITTGEVVYIADEELRAAEEETPLYLIILSGEVEIGLGDGSTHLFGAGTALLVEDTTGQGHTTLIIDGDPVIQAVIPLAHEA